MTSFCTPEEFTAAFEYTAYCAHANAVEKGFWDDERNVGEAIALMHSELSELLEGLRAGDPRSEKIPQFSQAEEEAADLVIRLMDTARGMGWKVGEAINAKMEYNRSRPHKHGKVF